MGAATEVAVMPVLKITARGQVTLRKEYLRHIGVKPGETAEIDLDQPNRLTIQPLRRTGRIEDVFGLLKGKSKVKATIQEIKEATERAWAGER
jgi:bifunctional DNA-binding transcriptional regulator/antitoxin component of YhaV-PrlF toxin-antitoxin module